MENKKLKSEVQSQDFSMLGKQFFTTTVELTNSIYFRILLEFPNGTYLEKYVSYDRLIPKQVYVKK